MREWGALVAAQTTVSIAFLQVVPSVNAGRRGKKGATFHDRDNAAT